MTFKEIQDLIKLVSRTGLTEFKMKDGEFNVHIRTEKYTKETTVHSTQQIVPVQTSMPAVPQYPIAATPPPAPAPEVAAAPPAKKAETPAEDTSNLLEVKSPIVGTFYRSPSPDKPAYVKVGDTIEKGQVVCIIEAMKLFNEIESEVSGKIVKVLMEDSSPVEYEQVLFLVDPNG